MLQEAIPTRAIVQVICQVCLTQQTVSLKYVKADILLCILRNTVLHMKDETDGKSQPNPGNAFKSVCMYAAVCCCMHDTLLCCRYST